MSRMFDFDSHQYAAQYSAEGFVHVPRGLSDAFYQRMSQQVDDYLEARVMAGFSLGNKQQALYDFPSDADYLTEFFETVGAVCGVDPKSLVLSERHIKAYDADARPEPDAHKDRFASEISVGIAIRVQPGSTLVLYPYDEVGVNPFNSSAELYASLSSTEHPRVALRSARSVEITDQAGDVVMFRGNCIWHLRRNPANTRMLYLKLNTFNCDPLGEDPFTEKLRRQTTRVVEGDESQFERVVPVIGRKVDYFHRRYGRDWREVIGVVLCGELHLTINDLEFAVVQAIDGKRTVGEVVDKVRGARSHADALNSVRRLAERGVVDLVIQPLQSALSSDAMNRDMTVALS